MLLAEHWPSSPDIILVRPCCDLPTDADTEMEIGCEEAAEQHFVPTLRRQQN